MNVHTRISIKDGEDLIKELILYVAVKCKGDPGFGSVKLNKILWRSDFMAFARLGAPLTGLPYWRLPLGPVPRWMLRYQEHLEAEGRMEFREEPVGAYIRKMPIPLGTPDMSKFSKEQIEVVDDAIQHYWGLTAAQVSQDSHGMAWEVTPHREEIPYEYVFLAERMTDEELAHAQRLFEAS